MMRKWFAALPLFALAACGGGGTDAQTIGSVAPPTGSGNAGSGGSGDGVGNGGTATPTPSSGGTGGGVTGTGSSTTPSTDHFLSVAGSTSFNAVGSFHSLSEDKTTGGQLYTGNASTVRSPSGTITYDPRSGTFTMTVADTTAGVSRSLTFQDPAHRYNFNPANKSGLEAPLLDNFNYLVVRDGDTPAMFFYQRPGSSTKYVSLAGYTRSNYGASSNLLERGAFVFGSTTPQSQIPVSGGGTYTGGFIASMIANRGTGIDMLQWMYGSSNISVDFAKATVNLGFTGTVGQSYRNGDLVNDDSLALPSGATFTANGTAAIDLVRSGGFSGKFSEAKFTWPTKEVSLDFQPVNPDNSSAGASSIDGGFYGPNAVNLGGSFRIVGGIPGQRVDVQGAFTGARK